VTGRATAEIADRTGVSAAATATASAARRAVGPDSAIGKTAAAVGEVRPGRSCFFFFFFFFFFFYGID
jgi:hypothetical protein